MLLLLPFRFTMRSTLLAVPRTATTSMGSKGLATGRVAGQEGETMVNEVALVVPPMLGLMYFSWWNVNAGTEGFVSGS
jgi:hypothetical protein